MSAEAIPIRRPRETLGTLWDALVLRVVRGVVDAVRYQPQHVALVLACSARQPEVPEPVVRWWAEVRVRPIFLTVSALPHAGVRGVASVAARWFGPTASAVVRWLSGATAAAADHASARPIERSLRARAHPGLLVPHPHEVAVLAVDMRGFSNLTRELHDTQYLSDLIGDYLTALTRAVERHGGVVLQYTGDGLLAVFLPELAGAPPQRYSTVWYISCRRRCTRPSTGSAPAGGPNGNEMAGRTYGSGSASVSASDRPPSASSGRQERSRSA